MKCRSCDSEITQFFSLGQMPLVNSFLRKEEIEHEETFDLSVGFCPQCYLVQLMNTVSPEKLFRNYIYFSSTSTSFLEHCKNTAEYLTKKLNLNSQSLVLEVASNDGVLLQYFQQLEIQILGVDPAENIAKVANEKGMKTIPEFFNFGFAKKLKEEEHIEADLVFGANVFAHVPEILDFVKGVQTILKPEGTAVFEFPYIKGLLENKFDTMYHEHVFYYSLLALQNLWTRANMEIYRIEMIPTQGGSLRIFASHQGAFPVEESVRELESSERSGEYEKIETYRAMERRVLALRDELLALLTRLRREGKHIAAYSAPAKGNILLNYFGLKNYLDFIVDKSEAKQGLYTPGTHFFVYPPEKIYEEKPDYLVILCWNIVDEVVKQLREYHDAGGKFIIPIPAIRIL